MSLMAEREEKHRSVKVFCDWILTIFGFYLIGHALQEAYGDIKNLGTVATLKDILSPFFLSFAILPFLYSLFIYCSYDRVFTSVDFGIKDKELKKYAKFYSVLNFRTDVDFLERWKRKIFLTDIKTKEDLKKSFEDIKIVKMREKNPVQVDIHEGWRPHEAKGFLQSFGIVTNDYHESFDEDWTASSNYLEIEDGYKLSNRIWYYINGDMDQVKKLTLKLYVNNLDIQELSEDKFLEVSRFLLSAAAVRIDDPSLVSFLKADTAEIIVNNYTKITSLKTTWDGGIKGGYDRKLIIENITF